MAQEWAKTFYRSKKWIRCRNSYIGSRILTDGGLCEECHDKLGYIVHHKIILTPENIEDPEVSLNHRHLKYVCKSCHDLYEGHGLQKEKPLCRFDSEGQPVSVREIDGRARNLTLPPPEKNSGGGAGRP